MKKEPRGSFFILSSFDFRLLYQLTCCIKDATVTKDIEVSVTDELLSFFGIGRYIVESIGFGVRFGTLYLHGVDQFGRTVLGRRVGVELDSIFLDGELGETRCSRLPYSRSK